MGNRLKILEAEVAREEEAIYATLSARLGRMLPSVLGAAEALARADVCAAIAQLARRASRSHFPTIVDDAAPRPRGARGTRSSRSTLPGRWCPSDLAVEARARHGRERAERRRQDGRAEDARPRALMVRAGLPRAVRRGQRGRASSTSCSPTSATIRAFTRTCRRSARTCGTSRRSSARAHRARSCCSTSSRAAPIRAKARRSRRACSTRSSSHGARGRRDDALRRAQGARARRSALRERVRRLRPRDDEADVPAHDGRARRVERARGRAAVRHRGRR